MTHDPLQRPPASGPIPGGLFDQPRRVAPAPPAFATDDPPRRTARQATRWTTSDEAYVSAPAGIALRVLESLRDHGPATCDELEQRLGLTHQTCSAAVNAVMNSGRIVADGSRPTRSGRRARVWRVVEGGIDNAR